MSSSLKIPFDLRSLLLYRNLVQQLRHAAADAGGVLAFGRPMNSAFQQTDFHPGRVELGNDEQIKVMKELEAAGLVVIVPFKGWRLLEPDTENADPVLAEFGHACQGCAMYPCEKSKAGEPDGDCYDYRRG